MAFLGGANFSLSTLVGSIEEGSGRAPAPDPHVRPRHATRRVPQQKAHALRRLLRGTETSSGISRGRKNRDVVNQARVRYPPGHRADANACDASSSTAPAWKEFSAPLLMAYSNGRPMTALPLDTFTTRQPALPGRCRSSWTCDEAPPWCRASWPATFTAKMALRSSRLACSTDLHPLGPVRDSRVVDQPRDDAVDGERPVVDRGEHGDDVLLAGDVRGKGLRRRRRRRWTR